MSKLVPINLPRETGYKFFMAFVFTKQGTQLLTGDYNYIDRYCAEHFGICHGVMMSLNDRAWLSGKKYNSYWRLFGRKFYNYANDFFLTDFDMHSLNSSYTSAYWREKGIKRPCWALYKKGGDIIRTWRRLPKEYVNWGKLIAEAKENCLSHLEKPKK
jgi:hypothetical protein